MHSHKHKVRPSSSACSIFQHFVLIFSHNRHDVTSIFSAAAAMAFFASSAQLSDVSYELLFLYWTRNMSLAQYVCLYNVK